jgi:hypothetical protein
MWSFGAGAACLPAMAQSPEAVLRREAAHRERLRIDRFAQQATAGPFRVGAMFLGRTAIANARNVFVRNHLVVELLVEPLHSDGIVLNLGLVQLRVNGEKDPRMPQTPELVSYYIRSSQDAHRPRLEASAGIGNAGVVLDTGSQRRARFPGDPRTPPPRPHPKPSEQQTTQTQQDSLDADAELVTNYAFRGGPVHGPTVGFLYYPFDLDLRKIRNLELLVFADGETKPPAVLRLR